MRITEVISRRNLLKGLAGTAATAALPAMAKDPNEEDVYWGARQDYTTKPRKLYPNIAVNKPNQYIKEMDLIVYDGMIFNPMTYKDFSNLKKLAANLDVETLPANTIAGLADKIYLTQMGNYNYFVSQQQVNKFAQQYQVDALVKRNYDVKQKMARGDWGATGKGITKPAPDIGTNTGDIQEPLYPWQRPNISQNI